VDVDVAIIVLLFFFCNNYFSWMSGISPFHASLHVYVKRYWRGSSVCLSVYLSHATNSYT